MDKNEMIEAAKALVGHLEADRLEDAQAIASDLDFWISQATPPVPPMSPEEKKWVAEILVEADRRPTREQT